MLILYDKRKNGKEALFQRQNAPLPDNLGVELHEVVHAFVFLYSRFLLFCFNRVRA